MKVLGIDPGTGRLGWAVVEKNKGKETLLDYGCIETIKHTSLPKRLEKIYLKLLQVIKKHQPQDGSIENLYFTKNAKTIMEVGAARGVAILACQQTSLNVYFYTPLQIKSSLTGHGKANKKQVQFMVKNILKLKTVPQPDDAADAVAAALTHLSRPQVLK